jgi:ubiquinone/menaquinone biosynthesis C-methylase UbiE
MDLKKLKYHLGKNLTISQFKNRKNLKRIVRKLKGNILDLGCGNGEYSLLMAMKKKNKITSLDTNQELIDEIKKNIRIKKIKNITVVKGDAQELLFEKDSFDVVFCNTVLEHVPEPEKVIKESLRVLKKEGIFVVSIPFLQEVHGDPYDFQRYTPYGLKYQLEKQGFKQIKILCDYGSLNTIEYLLLGSIVWRVRLGFLNNFPFGYLYILTLILLFGITKLFHFIFFPLQKRDKHFITQVTGIGRK